MKANSFIAITAVLTLAACHTNLGNPIQSQEVAFETAEGYFFRNDRPTPEEPIIITSKEELEENFGYAATMSSQPTTIDFTSQVAIALVSPQTNQSTQITIKNVTKQNNDTLIIAYHVSKGKQISYTIQPINILLIDNHQLPPIVVAKEE